MAEGFSIGRLAALTGLPVKTIRFYSDAGLLPPSGRTEAGHRRYTATDVARLQLVRTLRERISGGAWQNGLPRWQPVWRIMSGHSRNG